MDDDDDDGGDNNDADADDDAHQLPTKCSEGHLQIREIINWGFLINQVIIFNLQQCRTAQHSQRQQWAGMWRWWKWTHVSLPHWQEEAGSKVHEVMSYGYTVGGSLTFCD